MSFRTKMLVLFAGLLFVPKLFPVSFNREVKVLLMKDGLLSDYVNCVEQDKQNMIWIGTEFGLNRFDGVSMSAFTFDPQNPYSLSNNVIHDIYPDKDGSNVWIATEGCLNKYEYKSGRFLKFKHQPQKNAPAYNDIVKIIARDENSFWLASYRGGVHIFDKKTGKITWVNEILKQVTRNDAALRVRTILYDDNNTDLWIATQGNGLFKYQTKTKLIERYFEKTAAGISFDCMYSDGKNTIWVGSNKGLFKYNSNTNSFVVDKRFSFLNQHTITDLKASKNKKELYLSTDRGLYVVSIAQLESDVALSYKYISEGADSKGLSTAYVNSVFEDHSQNLWVSTASGGVNLLLNKPSKFEVVFRTGKNSGTERKILPVTEDLQGRLWMGYSTDALFVSDTLKHNFSKSTIISELRKTGTADIQSLCFSKSNVLWIGTANKGLISYDFTNRELYIYNNQNSNIPDNDIRVIKEDSKGNIWVATNRGGLCSFYQKSQSFEVYNPTDRNISFAGISSLVEDNEGNWWMGTDDNGLKMFNPQTNTSFAYSSAEKGNFYIPDNYISSLYIDTKGQVWLGSRNGGLSYFNKNNNGFKAIPSRVGLPQSISHIEGDKKGNLWISAINSVFCYNPTNNTIVSYRQSEGINAGLFLLNSGIKTRSGRIYFAATKGLLGFNPNDFYASSEKAFSTLITGIQISNRAKDENENVWIRNLEVAQKLELAYYQSSFTIHFVSPNYEHSNEIKYAYYLEGEESTWNYMGNNSFASYRNLEPGKYVFKVKASNANNIWSEKTTELILIITPPFWARWYMKLVYFLLFLLSLWGLWKYTIARLRRINNLRLKEIEREKTNEVNNAKLQFFTNISHEFRTPITLILSPLSKILEHETDPEKKYLLDLMRKNSNRLLRLVNEVLDFRKLDKENIELHYEKVDVIQFTHELFNSFSVLSKDKNIDMIFNHQSDNFSVYIDKEVIEKTIVNLLSNALKFSHEGGEVTLTVENDEANESIIIEVLDNGIGLNAIHKNRIFELFYQAKTDHQYTEPGSGIGLYLVKSLVELHKGKITVESEENKGCKFTVILPYNQQNSNSLPETPSEITNEAIFDNISEIDEVLESQAEELHKIHQSAYEKVTYTLLVVEDDTDVRQFLVNEFSSEFKIMEAENGEEALLLSKDKHIDIVLSDIMMPRMNGIQFCEAFKKDINTSHIPLILLTAKSSIENKIEGIEYGADDYVIKPFSVKYLRTKMYSLLRKKEEMRKVFGKNFTISEPELKVLSIDDVLITKAIDFIRLNITNAELNGEVLADHLNISRVHLYRKLKAIVDCSSSEFIRRVRLKHAITLLDANNLNISEVAYDCGFNSPAYFSTCFSSFYGMSPKEYIHKKHGITQPKNDFESMMD